MKKVYKTDYKNGPSFEIEAGLFAQGYRCIAGIDEAGRGCLAGPLSVAAVIFEHGLFFPSVDDELSLINDSKKLSPKKRVEVSEIIRKRSLYAVQTSVQIDVIDKKNINGATFEGVLNLLSLLPVKPDCIIMDGNFNFKFDIPFYPIIKGDQKSISIASASIIAKVIRDNHMDELGEKYPGYGFISHKGYGTSSHIKAIRTYGPTPEHRKSFEPVRSIVEEGVLFPE